MIQRFKFHPPSRTKRGETLRQEIIRPVGGIDQTVPPWNLGRGRTPYAENCRLTRDRLGVEKRPGLQNYFGVNNIPGSAQPFVAFMGETTDGQDEVPMVLTSANSGVYYRNPTTGNWVGSTALGVSSYTADVHFATVYSASDSSTHVVWTNGDQLAPNSAWFSPKLGSNALNQGVGSFLSHASTAKYVASFNERLLFFNTSIDSTTVYPKRVHWSVKGSPFDFNSIGAGFQDIADMHGEGTGMVANKDFLVLWSTEDVWIGRARNDAFGFDFLALEHSVGADMPSTIVETDAGPIWMNSDCRIWRLAGTQVVEVGREIKNLLRSEVSSLEGAYATYLPSQREYRIYFLNKRATASLTSDPPNACVVLHTDTMGERGGSWFYYTYDKRLPAGDEGFVISSDATPYIEEEGTHTDQVPSGQQTFDMIWQTPATRARDASQREAVAEVWIDGRGTLLQATSKEASSAETLYASGSKSFGTTSLDTTVFFPMNPVASRHPLVELKSTDGVKAEIHNVRLTLRAYSGRF